MNWGVGPGVAIPKPLGRVARDPRCRRATCDNDSGILSGVSVNFSKIPMRLGPWLISFWKDMVFATAQSYTLSV